MFEEVDGSSDLEFALISIKIVWIQMFLIITDKSNNKEVLLESYIWQCFACLAWSQYNYVYISCIQ